jgi:predicted aspartyl protease
MVNNTTIQTNSSQIWVQEILKNPSQFESYFVVHDDTDILFKSKLVLEADAWLNENSQKYGNNLRIFLIPNEFGQVRLRMLKIKSLSFGEWMPMAKVFFILPNGKKITLEMLVDSGADVTFIPFQLGQTLGFTKSFGESSLFAAGVGSKVSYLIRECKIQIDNKELTIRLLWGQDENVGDILLGRLDVFDHFDVTISQYRQKVIFEPVNIFS